MAKNRVLNYLLNNSVTHSLSLFDNPGTEAFASEQKVLASIGEHDMDVWLHQQCVATSTIMDIDNC